ncbi:MAG: carbohydrate-binding domain-containing protein [Candidatus Enterenecus sp.]
MKLRKWPALALAAAMILGLLSGCGDKTGGTETGGVPSAPVSSASSAPSLVPSGEPADPAGETETRDPAEADLTGAAEILLSGSTAQISGSGASEEKGVITITAGGTYVLSGTLEDGCVIVDAKGKDVTLVLNGADITCSNGCPLYIYNAQSAVVHVMEGTQNSLTDGGAYTLDSKYYSAADEEPNACLYSKDDLILQGAGALEVNANYDNGVTSRDTLEIYDVTLSVRAANHGINGKDSNTIDSAKITVTCGGDAIRSTNDSDGTLGWISISNSDLDLTAGEDGVQAETTVSISGGSYRVTSGGGSGARLASDASAKGVKAGTDLTLTGGTFLMDCADDAFHTNGSLTVSGGVYTVSTGDDAFHADETLTVSGGEINVLTSYEGLEGSDVTFSGGTARIVASDDGVNAAGGMDASGFGGRGGMGGPFGTGGGAHTLTVSGGTLIVDAGGDGLDSNGSITMTGGTVIVSSAGAGDSAVDCDSGAEVTGGTLWAASFGTMMTQAPGSGGQCVLSLSFGQTLAAGTWVEISGEGESFAFQTPIGTGNLVFSSPELVLGGEYTVSCGGTYDGAVTDHVGSGGTCSGGTELAVVTLSGYVTSWGSQGGTGFGGRGGMQGGKMR